MAISRFKTSSVAQRLPKYRKLWSTGVGKVGSFNTATVTGTSTDIRQTVSNGTNRIVACSYSDAAWSYSANGITWYSIPTKPASSLAICWDGSQFVSVDYASTLAVFSTDGTTWSGQTTTGTLPSGVAGIAYGGGKYVIAGRSNSTPSYSSDGVAWTATTGVTGGTADGRVIYGNGTFIITEASNSTTYWTSTNGTSFTARTAASSVGQASYANGLFFMHSTAASQTTYYYSANGTSWTAGTFPSSQYWTGVTWCNGVYIAVGAGGSAQSYDGINWTSISGPSMSGNLGSAPQVVGNNVVQCNLSSGAGAAKYISVTLG